MKTLPLPSIDALVKQGDIEDLREALNEMSPFEIAHLIPQKTGKARSMIFGALSTTSALKTFEFLPVQVQRNLLQTLPSMQAAYLLNNLTPDNRTAFLQDLPRSTVDELVKLLPNEERILTLTLLGYPEGSVGRLMTPDYIAVKMDWTIEECINFIRSYGQDSETIDVIYVIDDNGKLLTDIKLREFLFLPGNTKIHDIPRNNYVALSVLDRDEIAINLFRKYNRVALPVIDDEGNLLGIVTIDDILRVLNKEVRKDIQKIGGMESLSDPYLDTPFFVLIKKRAIWLIIFFLGGSLAGLVLSHYKQEIFNVVELAFFIPLILSIGGNAGSQATALIISSMAAGEIKLTDWKKVLKREILSGVFLGSILGILALTRITIFSFFSNLYGEYWFLLAETACITIIIVVSWGSLVGAMLPFILRRFGFDPATSSAPFVSSIISVTALIIYFGIAYAILKGTLL